MGTTSAVIPCYNAADFLAQAIESVLAQTRPVDEIILIDDCSTDESAAIGKSYGVSYLKTPVNSGEAAARNLGIRAAKGDFIAWLDADDYWDPNHCLVVSQLLEEHKEAAVAFSGVRHFGEKEGCWLPRLVEGEPVNAFWECFRRTIVPANSVIARRSILLEIGGFDETVGLAPDFDLWLRLSRRHPFVCTRQITSNYRWHKAQLSRMPQKQLQSLYEGRRRLLEIVRKEGEYALAEDIQKKMVEIWDEDLLSAWHHRDMKRLRFLLSLSHLLPSESRVKGRWNRRALLPLWMFRVWDQLPRPLRRVFRKAILWGG